MGSVQNGSNHPNAVDNNKISNFFSRLSNPLSYFLRPKATGLQTEASADLGVTEHISVDSPSTNASKLYLSEKPISTEVVNAMIEEIQTASLAVVQQYLDTLSKVPDINHRIMTAASKSLMNGIGGTHQNLLLQPPLIEIDYPSLMEALKNNPHIENTSGTNEGTEVLTTAQLKSMTVGEFQINVCGLSRIGQVPIDPDPSLWDTSFLAHCAKNGGILQPIAGDAVSRWVVNDITSFFDWNGKKSGQHFEVAGQRFLIYRLFNEKDILVVADRHNLSRSHMVFNGLFADQGGVDNLGFLARGKMLPLIAGLLPQFFSECQNRIGKILGVDSNTDGYQTKMNQIQKMLDEMANRNMDTYQFTPTGMGINTTTLVSVHTEGHQMMMSVTKTQDDQFSVVLHNTGSGLDIHHTRVEGNVEGKPDHYFKGQQAILTADQLSRLLAGTHAGKKSNIRVKEFYDRLKALTNGNVNNLHPGPEQTGENCVAMSFLESILYELAGHHDELGKQLIALFMEWHETPLQSDFKDSGAGVIGKLPPPAPDR